MASGFVQDRAPPCHPGDTVVTRRWPGRGPLELARETLLPREVDAPATVAA